MTNQPWNPRHVAFQQALRELRDSQGLQQAQLAEQLGKPQSYVSKYENGERKLSYLELLDILDACENSVSEFHALYLTKVAEAKAEYSYKQSDQ